MRLGDRLGLSFSLIAFGFVGTLFCVGCSPKSESALQAALHKTAVSETGIIGGAEVAGDDPIAVSTGVLYLENRAGVCTVSVLNSEWVLSAGHCADGLDMDKMEVAFALNPGDSGDGVDISLFRKIREVKVNPKFIVTGETINNLVKKALAEGREVTTDEVDQVKDWGDVSLLRLDRPVPASIRPSPLLPAGTTFQKGQIVTLAGYGTTASYGGIGVGSGTLRKVDVTVEEPVWGTTEILFDQRQHKGACHGDSGGPAYVTIDGKQYLFGVTSRGVHDAQDNCGEFAAYTNIDAYREWITESIVPTPQAL